MGRTVFKLGDKCETDENVSSLMLKDQLFCTLPREESRVEIFISQ